jgi:hypothetical protein
MLGLSPPAEGAGGLKGGEMRISPPANLPLNDRPRTKATVNALPKPRSTDSF